MRTARLLHGHVLDLLAKMPEGSVHCCVTSPPYFGLRDYKLPPQIWDDAGGCAHAWALKDITVETGTGGNWTQGANGDELRTGRHQGRFKGDFRAAKAQTSFCRLCGAWRGSLGLEPTVQLYVAHIVQVFRAVRRVLRDDGTLWLNLGDGYAASKDLFGVPWRVALALQDQGWYLRSEIIWAKSAPMPESVRDRPTRAHEHIFLLSKRPTYYYDAAAVREPGTWPGQNRSSTDPAASHVPGTATHKGIRKRGALNGAHGTAGQDGNGMRMPDKWSNPAGRNMRTVWEIGPEPCPDAHFATFPSEIPRKAIAAGTSAAGCCSACGAPWRRETVRTGHVSRREPAHVPGNTVTKADSSGWAPATRPTNRWRPTCACGADAAPCVVLDPFLGSGRTGATALEMGRSFVGTDLSKTYLETIARPAIQNALQAHIGEEEPPRIVVDPLDQGKLW